MNYKHLHYFYMIAREGSIVQAAESLHVSPQTISGQLTVFEKYLGVELFDRKGKRLVLNNTGKLVYSYAEDIFSLGAELGQALKSRDLKDQLSLTVGVIDVIPKILAFNIIKSCMSLEGSIKLICREGSFDALLSELATNKLDLIISDRPLTPGVPIKAYNHYLGQSGVSFYAEKKAATKLRKTFPKSLDRYPFLMCGDTANQRINLNSWFESEQISPIVVAEFDDTALLKFFGQSGYGIFCTPTTIEDHVVEQYGVSVIGRTQDVSERFYAISPERKVKHPGVKILVESAQSLLS